MLLLLRMMMVMMMMGVSGLVVLLLLLWVGRRDLGPGPGRRRGVHEVEGADDPSVPESVVWVGGEGDDGVEQVGPADEDEATGFFAGGDVGETPGCFFDASDVVVGDEGAFGVVAQNVFEQVEEERFAEMAQDEFDVVFVSDEQVAQDAQGGGPLCVSGLPCVLGSSSSSSSSGGGGAMGEAVAQIAPADVLHDALLGGEVGVVEKAFDDGQALGSYFGYGVGSQEAGHGGEASMGGVDDVFFHGAEAQAEVGDHAQGFGQEDDLVVLVLGLHVRT